MNSLHQSILLASWHRTTEALHSFDMTLQEKFNFSFPLPELADDRAKPTPLQVCTLLSLPTQSYSLFFLSQETPCSLLAGPTVEALPIFVGQKAPNANRHAAKSLRRGSSTP